jgi:hypothetical protein
LDDDGEEIVVPDVFNIKWVLDLHNEDEFVELIK